MNMFLFVLFVVLIIFSQNASAHLKWFVDSEQLIQSDIQYSLSSVEVIISILLCLVCILFAFFLNRKITFCVKFSMTSKEKILRVFLILIGFFLLSASYSETILAAHYMVTNPLLLILQYAQAIVGLMLIFNLLTTYAAFALIGIYILLGTQFGMLEVLDYLNILGVALFLVFNNSKDEQMDFAVPVIRVLTGAALVVLAFSEKLLNPNFGLNFLAANDWNFMKTFGMTNYSNELFILSAGFVELLIGILFILGLITRINTIVLLSFMVTSNIVFFYQNSASNAWVELAGHLPVIAIALILLSSGAGQKWRLN